MRFKQDGQCKLCPLRGQKKVYGKGLEKDPSIIFIGEAPGETEDEMGEPFVGSAGKFLSRMLAKAGILEQNTYKMNVLLCRPPLNDIKSEEAVSALDCCRNRFYNELKEVSKSAKVLVPLGNTALKMLFPENNISKVRGSVLLYEGLPTVPAFHPSYILRGNFQEEVTTLNDLEKARRICEKGYTAPKERFNLFPTVTDVRNFVEKALKKPFPLVAVDLETTNLTPTMGNIIMVGLAMSDEEALVVPILRKGGLPYWNGTNWSKVRELLVSLFLKGRLIFQNALFDMRHIEYNFEITMPPPAEDIMLLHHAIHPELPHNLGYITSVYGDTPFWKEEVLNRKTRLLDVDDETLRTYNARDCVVLHQVLPSLLDDIEDRETIYRDISLKLVRPILDIVNTGIFLDKKNVGTFKKELEGVKKSLLKQLYSLKVSTNFNLGSSQDLAYLLYGKTPAKCVRAEKDLASYEKNTKKRKDTKKYKGLVESVESIKGTIPVKLPTGTKPKTTDKGTISTDEEAMLSLIVACNNEVSRLMSLKTPKKKEADEYNRTKEVLEIILSYKENEKLLSTYSEFTLGNDGRVHGSYLIHGTTTGRLSSRDPNMQNVPKRVRKLFIPQEGNVFIQGDYSNLELRVLAIVAEDDVLQGVFDQGLNAHSGNCKLMFEMDETHPLWDSARKACKIYIFGRNYGGGPYGIFQRVAKEVPSLGLTYAQFKKVDSSYRRAHPKYVIWESRTRERVRNTRMLANMFGRVRIFLGLYEAIEREGLNFPIQSTASDIFNKGLIGLHGRLMKELPSAKICAVVHDSILVECPEKSKEKVAKIMKEELERELTFTDGRSASFPIDIKVGTSWGDV